MLPVPKHFVRHKQTCTSGLSGMTRSWRGETGETACVSVDDSIPYSEAKLPCRSRYVPIFQPAHIILSITHSTLLPQWHTPLQVHSCSGRSCTHSAPTYPHLAACQRLCSSSGRVCLHLLTAFIRITCLLASMRSFTARLCCVVLLVRVSTCRQIVFNMLQTALPREHLRCRNAQHHARSLLLIPCLSSRAGCVWCCYMCRRQ